MFQMFFRQIHAKQTCRDLLSQSRFRHRGLISRSRTSKSTFRSPLKPLQQNARRLSEVQSVYSTEELKQGSILHGQHNNGPILNLKVINQYTKISIENFTFVIEFRSRADCYCLIKNGYKKIHNICTTIERTFIIGKHFLNYRSLYIHILLTLRIEISAN